MKRFLGLALAVSLVLFPLFTYTYLKGCRDGVVHYQRSNKFFLTLLSMYNFGVADGCRDKSRCHG